MPQHRFAVGEVVEFAPAPGDRSAPRGRYTVERLVPVERGRQPQYHVRHRADGHQRVVEEGRLSPAAASPTWPPPG